jgi:hypothetical protein
MLIIRRTLVLLETLVLSPIESHLKKIATPNLNPKPSAATSYLWWEMVLKQVT